MKGKQAVLMKEQTLPPAPPENSDYSESESLSLSDSFGESVGSVDMARCSEPKPSLDFGSPSERKKKGGANFLNFTKELLEVPVQKAWAFVRDHKMMASLVPGIIEGFDFIEGEGGSGSIYIANYNPKCVKPGEDHFLVNKVEVSDEESKLYVVNSVGGKYMKVYNLYIQHINVLAHDVHGDSSSVVEWRFEYDLIDPKSPPPELSKQAYMAAIDLIKARYLTMNRVERPLIVSRAVVVNVTKRLRVPDGQKRLTGPDEQQEPENRSKQRARRKRKGKGKGKGKAQQSRPLNDPEGSDRESRVRESKAIIQTAWWEQICEFQAEGRRGRFNNQD